MNKKPSIKNPRRNSSLTPKTVQKNQKSSKKEDHNISKIKETLRILIKKFDMNFFTKLLRQTNPSQKLRNLILIFLTIFHDELNNLIEDTAPIPPYV